MSLDRDVRRGRGDEADCVDDLVQHAVVEVAGGRAIRTHRVRRADGRRVDPVIEAPQVERGHVADERGRIGARATELAAAVVVDRVDLAGGVEAERVEVGLDLAAAVTGRGDGRVGLRESHERDVRDAVEGVEPHSGPACLRGEPAVPRRDRVCDRAVDVELAVAPVAREDVHDVDLVAGDVVGEVRHRARAGVTTVTPTVTRLLATPPGWPAGTVQPRTCNAWAPSARPATVTTARPVGSGATSVSLVPSGSSTVTSRTPLDTATVSVTFAPLTSDDTNEMVGDAGGVVGVVVLVVVVLVVVVVVTGGGDADEKYSSDPMISASSTSSRRPAASWPTQKFRPPASAVRPRKCR